MEYVLDGQPIIKSIKEKPYVDLIGIYLTLQRVRIKDPDRRIIEYSMDEFKDGMLLNKFNLH